MSDASYRTKEGDVLDAICWRHYGNESSLERVLAANRGLADYGPVLPSNLVILLPAMPAPEVNDVITLWS